MLDEVFGTKCYAAGFLNYSNLCEVQNCVKCAEFEIQLQKVPDEYKEHVQEDTVAMLI